MLVCMSIYYIQSILSVLLPLCCPPLFSASFSSAALLSSSCYRYRCCWCCPHCTRSPRCCCCCCCCCCVQCMCLHQLMVMLGYEQPWCVTLFCAPASPAAHLLAAGMIWPARLPQALQLPFPGRGGGRGEGGGTSGLSLITGSDQKRHLNLSRVNPAGLEIYIYIYITLPHSPHRAKNDNNYAGWYWKGAVSYYAAPQVFRTTLNALPT